MLTEEGQIKLGKLQIFVYVYISIYLNLLSLHYLSINQSISIQLIYLSISQFDSFLASMIIQLGLKPWLSVAEDLLFFLQEQIVSFLLASNSFLLFILPTVINIFLYPFLYFFLFFFPFYFIDLTGRVDEKQRFHHDNYRFTRTEEDK